ncbi:MAG: hypothetical protein NTX03_06835 [Bacteroidetes bacterium]|nr:hypothetical protein [Bacteroidota bacterium]
MPKIAVTKAIRTKKNVIATAKKMNAIVVANQGNATAIAIAEIKDVIVGVVGVVKVSWRG